MCKAESEQTNPHVIIEANAIAEDGSRPRYNSFIEIERAIFEGGTHQTEQDNKRQSNSTARQSQKPEKKENYDTTNSQI